jgi:hypothetical protein
MSTRKKRMQAAYIEGLMTASLLMSYEGLGLTNGLDWHLQPFHPLQNFALE